MSSSEEIRSKIKFLQNLPENMVAFIIKDHANGDTWKDILVIYNANKTPQTISIPMNHWTVVCDKHSVNLEGITSFSLNTTTVEGISATVLYGI